MLSSNSLNSNEPFFLERVFLTSFNLADSTRNLIVREINNNSTAYSVVRGSDLLGSGAESLQSRSRVRSRWIR